MSEDATFPIISSAGREATGLTGRRQLEETAVLLAADDNVAVARVNLGPGLELEHERGILKLSGAIPRGHKFALTGIPQEGAILKYAHVIGTALTSIRPGEWVHDHNLEPSHDLDRQDYATERPHPPVFPADLPRTFRGYRRTDGRAGTRNYIVVVAASSCASHVCQAIAEELADVRDEDLHGVVALPHNEGCGTHDGPDIEQLERTLKGIIANPNVAAALMVGLGCEINQLARYTDWGSRLKQSNQFAQLEIQSGGGTVRTISEGVRAVREMAAVVRSLERSEQSASQLILGLNCGGSDAFSGMTANPALGWATDLLVAAGGTAVLAETPEIYGAEQSLARRAVDAQTGERLIRFIRRYQEYVSRFGATLDSNPSVGNRAGGISNVIEKSLGAVMKGGTTMLTAVVDYAGKISGPGLVFMDTPGYDPVSLTGIAAGGCNLIAFTTGRGSAIGFPVVPVLKIVSNSETFVRMRDNMDVNAGEILDGKSGLRDVGAEIYRQLILVASGRQTRSELLGHREFAPWRIGPVM